jgi:hypothetical protein
MIRHKRAQAIRTLECLLADATTFEEVKAVATLAVDMLKRFVDFDRCFVCGSALSYNAEHDSLFCSTCNIWAETATDGRPPMPSLCKAV